MEASIKKRSRPAEYYPRQQLALNETKSNVVKTQKVDVIRKMHNKIKEKYKKTFPNLKTSELKVLSAIVLIQRLWRQIKVKEMIGEFLTPRAFIISQNATFGKPIIMKGLK